MKDGKARGIREATTWILSLGLLNSKIAHTLGINPYNTPVSSFLRFDCCNSDTESADLSRFSAAEVGDNCGSDFRSMFTKIELKSVLTNSSKSFRLNISS